MSGGAPCGCQTVPTITKVIRKKEVTGSKHNVITLITKHKFFINTLRRISTAYQISKRQGIKNTDDTT